MALSEQLISKVKKAYTEFKKNVSQDEHDHVLALLEKIHFNMQAQLEGKQTSTIGSEFSHGLAALDRLSTTTTVLPTTKLELKTTVKADGELLGTGKWELLDPDWLEALEQWLIYYCNKAPFNTHPQIISIADTTSFVIAGDWGTGDWRKQSPSSLVAEQMEKITADYSIHLGDVYYAGTKSQEVDNLVNLWPKGSKDCFTLNSNHEMYNGGHSYFEQALTHTFTSQKGCSYFALENSNWLIIGLDTAYHADPLDLYLVGKLDDTQLSWLESLPKNKKIIILSHHQAFDITGDNNSHVYEQVIKSLGQQPDFWYWGHLHNAIVYHPKGNLHGRCIGHGAIPYGNASVLKGVTDVCWYEDKSADDAEIPVRVLNGFAYIYLTDKTITEQMIAENGEIRFSNKRQM